MQKTIAVIVPYFGALPTCFRYFAESVRHSPTIEVLLFTDARLEHAVPDNLKIHPYSLSEFNRLASRTLKMQVDVSFPYKLCDFRPAYGAIFQEYIREREFWGFGDIDVVYGNLDHFLAPILPVNDIVSCRKGWVSGSLCILRNCPTVNFAYKRSADWRRVFASPEYEHFDEVGGHFYNEMIKGADLRQLNGKIDSFTHVVRRLSQEGTLRCAFNDLACENLDWGETLVYDEGRLAKSKGGAEVMYVHWVKMKRRFFEVPRTTSAPRRFYVRKTGIYAEMPTQPRGWLREGARVLRGGLGGLRRLPGRCLKEARSLHSALHGSLRSF